MSTENHDRFADPINCSPADGSLGPINPLRSPAANAKGSKHFEMSDEKYCEIDKAGHVPIEYQDAGWHFCLELDEALVKFDDVSDFCKCFEPFEEDTASGLG